MPRATIAASAMRHESAPAPMPHAIRPLTPLPRADAPFTLSRLIDAARYRQSAMACHIRRAADIALLMMLRRMMMLAILLPLSYAADALPRYALRYRLPRVPRADAYTLPPPLSLFFISISADCYERDTPYTCRCR